MTSGSAPLFVCENLCVDVAGRRLVDDLSFELGAGQLVAILGRNGCGKTLTLHTLAGLRPAAGGLVQIPHVESAERLDVAGAKRQQIARRLALLPQHVDDIFPATVLDTALIGRHPHIGRMSWESADDVAVAKAALDAVDLTDFCGRDVLTLSGGERRRLAIAQVLTQEPSVYLLDEPTNHLDPQHQIEALQLFRRRADQGATVVASLHDVNLAVRFADQCLLLHGDGRWLLGATHEVLNTEHLSALYGTAIESVAWRERQLFVAAS